jgi:hypothetical protein
MSLHHMHQVGPRAASRFQQQSHPKFGPFRNHVVSSRRQLTVVAGEARSANRTKWTRQDAEQQMEHQADPNNSQTSNGAIQQLADIDPHELVSAVRLQQQRQQHLSDGTPAANLLVTPALTLKHETLKMFAAMPLSSLARADVPGVILCFCSVAWQSAAGPEGHHCACLHACCITYSPLTAVQLHSKQSKQLGQLLLLLLCF